MNDSNKKSVHVSASQIDTFRQCPRKWAWNYIAGVPKAQNRSAALGSRVHEILEKYFIDGKSFNRNEIWTWPGDASKKVFRPGIIALNMINEYCPTPGTANVEYEFRIFDKANDFYYIGKLDLNWYDAELHRLYILDHKTSVDPKKWGKKQEDLAKDIQTILYPWAALQRFKYADSVNFRLSYGATSGVASRGYVVGESFSPAQINELFKEIIEPTAIAMIDLKKRAVQPLKIKCNPNMCSIYGGCPHKDRCNLSGRERLSAFMSSDSLIDELLAEGGDFELADGALEKTEGDPLDDLINPPNAGEIPVKTVTEKEVATVTATETEDAVIVETVKSEKKKKQSGNRKKSEKTTQEKKVDMVVERIPGIDVDKMPIASSVADAIADAVADAIVGRIKAKLGI